MDKQREHVRQIPGRVLITKSVYYFRPNGGAGIQVVREVGVETCMAALGPDYAELSPQNIRTEVCEDVLSKTLQSSLASTKHLAK